MLSNDGCQILTLVILQIIFFNSNVKLSSKVDKLKQSISWRVQTIPTSVAVNHWNWLINLNVDWIKPARSSWWSSRKWIQITYQTDKNWHYFIACDDSERGFKYFLLQYAIGNHSFFCGASMHPEQNPNSRIRILNHSPSYMGSLYDTITGLCTFCSSVVGRFTILIRYFHCYPGLSVIIWWYVTVIIDLYGPIWLLNKKETI